MDQNEPPKKGFKAMLARMNEGHYARNLAAFWFLGMINNFAYVVVNSAAQSLTENFGKGQLIGLILWCNIAFGIVVRTANTFFLEGFSDLSRTIAAGTVMVLGLAGIAFSVQINEWFMCLASIVLIGSASALGESVMLAHMRIYPADIVSGWSSGTGMAGVGGSLVYMLFVAVSLGNVVSFYILAPFGIIFCLIFFFVLIPPKHQPISVSTADPSELEKASLIGNASSPPVLIEEKPDLSIQSRFVETKKQRYWRCFKLVWWPAINLMLVYFFEYVASVGGSDKAQPDDSRTSPNYFVKNAYVVLSFCYQLGVLVSRSSLSLVKIKRVGVITALQGINMFFWLAQAKWKFIHGDVGVWILFILMVYVGILGGGSYVNVFYLILHDRQIPDIDREVCINITATLVTVGITLSSVFIIIMDYTFLKSS